MLGLRRLPSETSSPNDCACPSGDVGFALLFHLRMDFRDVRFFSTGVWITEAAGMVCDDIGKGGNAVGVFALEYCTVCGEGDRRTGYFES